MNYSALEDAGGMTINVQIIDDASVEGDEKVNLRLTAPMGTSLGLPSAASLTIIDNDPSQ